MCDVCKYVTDNSGYNKGCQFFMTAFLNESKPNCYHKPLINDKCPESEYMKDECAFVGWDELRKAVDAGLVDPDDTLYSWLSPSPSLQSLGLPYYPSPSRSSQMPSDASQMPSDALSTSVFSSASVKGGLCDNGYDKKMLQLKPKWLLERDTYFCGQQAEGDQHKAAACMQRAEHITPPCAHCFGMSIACSYQHCEQECACSPPPPQESPECHMCVQQQCKPLLQWCTGLPVSDADSADYHDLPSSNFITV